MKRLLLGVVVTLSLLCPGCAKNSNGIDKPVQPKSEAAVVYKAGPPTKDQEKEALKLLSSNGTGQPACSCSKEEDALAAYNTVLKLVQDRNLAEGVHSVNLPESCSKVQLFYWTNKKVKLHDLKLILGAPTSVHTGSVINQTGIKVTLFWHRFGLINAAVIKDEVYWVTLALRGEPILDAKTDSNTRGFSDTTK